MMQVKKTNYAIFNLIQVKKKKNVFNFYVIYKQGRNNPS